MVTDRLDLSCLNCLLSQLNSDGYKSVMFSVMSTLVLDFFKTVNKQTPKRDSARHLSSIMSPHFVARSAGLAAAVSLVHGASGRSSSDYLISRTQGDTLGIYVVARSVLIDY